MKKKDIVIAVLAILIITAIFIYNRTQKDRQIQIKPSPIVTKTPKVCKTGIKRDLPDKLSQIKNLSEYPELKGYQKKYILKNGFVITPCSYNEIYSVYFNKYPYITLDSAFEAYARLYENSYNRIQRRIIYKNISKFSDRMLVASEHYKWWAMDKETKMLRNRAIAFFVVATKIQNKSFRYPRNLNKVVKAEMALINKASGIHTSPIFKRKIDYSQFKIKRNYIKMGNFYRSLVWYNIGFLRENNDLDLKSALYMSYILKKEKNILNLWEYTDSLLNFIVGPQKGYTPYDLIIAMNKATKGSLNKALKPSGLKKIRNELKKIAFDKKKIISKNKGIRFFGERNTVANEIISKMKGEKISSYWGPKNIDRKIILKNNIQKESLSALKFAFKEPKGRVPGFIGSESWYFRLLNSTLGGWSQLICAGNLREKPFIKYDKKIKKPKKVFGYVEPYPLFYKKMEDLTAMTQKKFKKYKVFKKIYSFPVPYPVKERLMGEAYRKKKWDRLKIIKDSIYADEKRYKELRILYKRLGNISKKQLKGKPLSKEDKDYIANYGKKLKWFSLNESKYYNSSSPMGVVCRPSKEYLFIGTGMPLKIYVTIKTKRGYMLYCGAIYSYYEFFDKAKAVISDIAWGKMLKNRLVSPWLKGKGLGLSPYNKEKLSNI